MKQIKKVIVVGGGSAGYMTALALNTNPNLSVVLYESPTIGTIRVGEGTTYGVWDFFHNFLKIPVDRFYREVSPTQKLVARFDFGPNSNPWWDYSLGGLHKLQNEMNLPAPLGFYIHKAQDFASASFNSRLVNARKSHLIPSKEFPHPVMYYPAHGYHFENGKIIEFFKKEAHARGIPVVQNTIRDVVLDPETGDISSLQMEDGSSDSADLYVDCSGFRSLLLSKTYKTRFIDYNDTIFCDRAVVGWHPRSRQEMLPCTMLEKMNAGWIFRIDHSDITARGYVFSSNHIGNDEAIKEYLSKTGRQMNDMRVVRFKVGTYERSWTHNVVAIGNSFSFIEPMEATAIHHIAFMARMLNEILYKTQGQPPKVAVDSFNESACDFAVSVRAFIEAHYKFGHGTGSKFWEDCNAIKMQDRAEAAYEWYYNVGPVVSDGPVSDHIFGKNDIFRWEGYFTTFMGCQAPTKFSNPVTDLTPWLQYKARQQPSIDAALPIYDAVDYVKSKL